MTLVNIGLTCSFLNDFELGIAIPISITGFGIGESLIPRSPPGLQDSGIIDFPVLNPGIKITGTGLQALDYRFADLSTSRIRKINYFDCTFSNDCCNKIKRIYKQETQLSADKPRDAFV